MKNLRFIFTIVLLCICFASCKNVDVVNDESQINETKLLAPKNFSVSYQNKSALNPATYSGPIYIYTFKFLPVEYAQNYLVYHCATNNKSKAEPLVVGTSSPLVLERYRGDPELSGMNFFWVRAYDGKNYGEWSEVVER